MEYENQTFQGLEYLQETIEEMVFIDCKFIKCDFHEIKVSGCTFRNCIFSGCTILNPKFKFTLAVGNIFEHCNLTGINWSDTVKAKTLLPPFYSLDDCLIKHNYFYHFAMKAFNFEECDLTGSIFEQCNLTNANFRRAQLADAKFDNNNLAGADFREAENYAISLEINKLKKAKFSFPEAIRLLEVVGIVVE
jgi:uncharacterized protein YjbI with pentapeptide repeats